MRRAVFMNRADYDAFCVTDMMPRSGAFVTKTDTDNAPADLLLHNERYRVAYGRTQGRDDTERALRIVESHVRGDTTFHVFV